MWAKARGRTLDDHAALRFAGRFTVDRGGSTSQAFLGVNGLEKPKQPRPELGRLGRRQVGRTEAIHKTLKDLNQIAFF